MESNEVLTSLAEFKKSSRLALSMVLVGATFLAASVYYSATRLKPLEQEIQAKLEKIAWLDQELAQKTGQFNVVSAQLELSQRDWKNVTAKLEEGKTKPAALDAAISTARRAGENSSLVSDSARDLQQSYVATSYYVIALTSATCDDVQKEIERVRNRVGQSFAQDFPDVEAYAPEGALCTLLVSGKKLPFTEATQLKRRAIDAGFGKDTWLWQSNVAYFSERSPNRRK